MLRIEWILKSARLELHFFILVGRPNIANSYKVKCNTPFGVNRVSSYQISILPVFYQYLILANKNRGLPRITHECRYC